MKHSEFWIQLFTGQKAISSKRVCGFTGWMLSLFICLWCTVKGIESPQIVDMLFICSTSLLGVEAITSVFHRSTGNTESQKTYKYEEEEPPKLL
jgi:hypothetical protein